MKKILSIFLKYPFYANLIVALLLIVGVASMLTMKKSFFPERPTRFIFVTVAYPGASPKEMEEGITTRIEQAIRGIPGIREINSASSENFTRVSIEMTGEYDIDDSLIEIKNAVDGISSFPVGAERPIVFKQRNATWAVRLGLTGEADYMTLRNYMHEIEDDMLASGVISQFSWGGMPDLEMSVEVSEENLLRYNLTIDEIRNAIWNNNRDISGGMIKSGEQEILIRSRARSVDANKIGDIVLRTNADGSLIRIRDIAGVKLKQSELVTQESFMNGGPVLYININKLIEEDLEKISAYVEDYVEEFNEKNNDVELVITYDFLTLLEARLSMLYENGGLGLLLVVISLALFLSFRLSLWVAWGIPASFLAMFFVGNLLGITINMISLFGMILIIGIVVDDGIVIAENIFAHWEMGKNPKKAALDGTMEVLPAVITSVLTTIIAFSPLLVITGRMEFMREMAIVVILSLAFSLVEAFFVLPVHVGTPHILRKSNKVNFGNRVRNRLEGFLMLMRDKLYAGLLRRVIRWRYIILILPISFILITVGLFQGGIIQGTFFPQIQFDSFTVNLAFKPGEGQDKTLEYLKEFDDIIWEVNQELKEQYAEEIEEAWEDTSGFVNYTFVQLGNAFNGQESGGHAGSIDVLLRDMEGSPISSYEIANRVREKIGERPDIEKLTVGGQNRWGKPVAISLLGNNLEELEGAKEMLLSELHQMPELTNIEDVSAAGKPEVRLKLKPKAYILGLNINTIASQVRQGFFGDQAQRLQKGKDEIRVYVRYPKTGRSTLGQLEDMKVKTPMGDFPLSELVHYDIERGPVTINRFNGSREMRIESDLTNPYDPVPPILTNIRENVLTDIISQHPGVEYVFQGQQRDAAESQQQIMHYFGIAFLIMWLVIMIHFKSFAHSLIIILMIPLGWLGAIWGHGFESWLGEFLGRRVGGMPVSILSAWGMIALSGVIINDAVVFLQKYNNYLNQGLVVKEAVFRAGLSRFRPIVLTTVTTSIGLYPLILEKSFQAQFLVPMAISLAYGVLVGTFFILTFFPVLIMVVNDTKYLLRWMWTGNKPENREIVEKTIVYKDIDIE